MKPEILREYDIRGTVGVNLEITDAKSLGLRFAYTMLESGLKSICVCRDGRLSSPALKDALVEGLTLGGVDVTYVGEGPSPLLYFAVKNLKLDAGIMVTGSHNPKQDNGFKICLQNGPFFGGQIKQLLKTPEVYACKKGSVKTANITDAYINMLLNVYKPGLRKIKVCFDPGNGAAGEILQKLLEKINEESKDPVFKTTNLAAHIINQEVDGNFPNHHPDPSDAENLTQLIDFVLHNNMDVGIAFDGDGDRIGVVDEKGRVLWGDQITTILAQDVLKNNPGAKIIGDVKCSQILFDEIANHGGKPLMVATGHSNIKVKMIEEKAILAGEMSGHIFFAENHCYDDALYAAIKLLNILHDNRLTVGDLIDRLPQQFSTPESRIPCPDEQKFALVEEVAQALAQDSTVKVDRTDGVRVVSQDGWWVLRASNTQPVLSTRCEAYSAEGLEKVKAHLQTYIQTILK